MYAMKNNATLKGDTTPMSIDLQTWSLPAPVARAISLDGVATEEQRANTRNRCPGEVRPCA